MKQASTLLRHWALLALIIIITTFAACHDQNTASQSNESESLFHPGSIEIALALTGYNYTNRYIHQFTVDGQGGGNLYVSGPDGGGGGTTCCVTYIKGASAWKATVRWQVGGCTYNNEVVKGTKLFSVYPIFKEAEIQVNPHIPLHPNYFEVHFYPDGHVEAVLTEESSRPRLTLSGDREDKSDYERCPNGKKPKSG